MIYSTKTSPALEKWECQDGVKNENSFKQSSCVEKLKIAAKDIFQIMLL